jgi:hypothetical protein
LQLPEMLVSLTTSTTATKTYLVTTLRSEDNPDGYRYRKQVNLWHFKKDQGSDSC